MSKVKYLQLVEHSEPFTHYAIHEGLLEDSMEPYWVGSKPIRKFDKYEDALIAWGVMDSKYSGLVDIVHYDDVSHLMDRVDYSDDVELNFD